MSRQDLIQELLDIRKYSQLILEHTAHVSQEEYLEEQFTRLAVERAIMIIGEAAVRIRDNSPEVFDQIDSLRSAIGTRNRLAHGYGDEISDEAIWNIVIVAIPDLLKKVESLVDDA